MTFLRKRLIERYIVEAILPYFALSFLLLTAVLLSQQIGKFAEILGTARAPLSLLLDATLGLVPNVLIFTLPMAMLVGTATGFARMGSDSELVALRAAGTGTLRVLGPVVMCGLLLTSLTVWDGFAIAPAAARMTRQALLRAAIDRLETPIQPRSFSTQMPGKVVYVRDGDEAQGRWGRVFIHWQDPGGDLRLVTARSGRIDLSGEQTELVLADAFVTTFPSRGQGARGGRSEVITERSAQLRVRLNTGRSSLVKQMQERPEDPDEADWRTLLSRSRTGSGKERLEAQAILQKRLALCFTPLTFAFLGVGLGGRAKRGGRALGVFLSLLSMLFFYLLLVGGDFLTRTGFMPAYAGEWGATILSLLLGLALIILGDVRSSVLKFGPKVSTISMSDSTGGRGVTPLRRISPLGFLDRNIIGTLLFNFTLSLFVLVSVFLIFTLFELLRFLTAPGSNPRLITLYLLHLIPLAGTGATPIALLISVLSTFALMARRSEAVAWWSAGQSLYRLAAPSLGFTLAICLCYWLAQEYILPASNARQEALRTQIRGGTISALTQTGSRWVATSDRRIYTFKSEGASGALTNPTLFEFDVEGVHLNRIVSGDVAEKTVDGQGFILRNADLIERNLPSGELRRSQVRTTFIQEPAAREAFNFRFKRPSELNFKQLSNYIKQLQVISPREDSLPSLTVAKWRKAIDPLSPLIMWLNGVPLAIAFGRRSAVVALGAAVLVGLTYWAGESAFQQLGGYNLIPASVATLSLPILYGLIGFFNFSRAKT